MAIAFPVFTCDASQLDAGALTFPSFVAQETGSTSGVVRFPPFVSQQDGSTSGVVYFPTFRLTNYGIGEYTQDGVVGTTTGADSYVEFVPLELTSSAAAQMGADSTVSAISQETSTAAATAGAASLLVFDTPAVFMEDMLGGATVGASAAMYFDGTTVMGAKAGASFVVEFVEPVVYSIPVDARGVEWGGAATVQESLVHIPTGGFVFGSGAQIQEVLPFKPSGGAVWGGAATATITYAPSVSGGYVYSGVAPISVVYTIEAPTGGIVFSGDAAEADRSAWHAPSGGFEWSGAATAYAQTAVYAASTENPTNDPYYAWSVNAENQAVSRYVRFFANSMAQLGGKTYVSNAGGIYEVGADDDAGQPIRASVLFPKTDFSESRTKRMEVAYLGAVTEGKLRLKMMANEDEPRYYAALPQGDSAKGAIVRIGKGMAGRYWTMRLDNVDGCDFELDSAEFKPIPSRTRHGA